MRIVFLTSSMSGGGAQRTIQYLSSFFATNNDVTIVSQADILFYKIDPRVTVKFLHINHAPSNIGSRIFNIIKCTFKTNYELAKMKPDVVFSMMAYDAKHILLLHRIMGFSLITSERNNPEMQKDDKVSRYKTKIFLQSDGIVFQTKRAMDFFPAAITKKGTIIPNAVGNALAYTLNPPKIRENAICAVGRLHKQKNYPMLFRAFQLFHRDYPSYVLKVFGQGPEEKQLKKLAEELGLKDRIIFEGQKNDALIDVNRSNCYVLSSDYEGMPNTLLEAMAVGVPCISTDCPNGPSELIRNGENGILVPVGDEKVLYRAMITAVTDQELRERCEKKAYIIRDEYSIEKTSQKYLDFVYLVHCNKKKGSV